MSDFFTKKQRKFWCETCKIFIEYTKLGIDQHQRSKNHLRLVNQDLEYKNQKAKFQKLNAIYNSQPDLQNNRNLNPIINNVGNNDIKHENFINQKIFNQKDPMSSYLPEDNKKQNSFLNKKIQRIESNSNSGQNTTQQQNNLMNSNPSKSRFNNQSLNAVLFDEIKKEKMKTEIQQTWKIANPLNFQQYNFNKMNNNINRTWTVFWDYTYNLPYYYNNFTGISQWEKPAEFDNLIYNQNSITSNDKETINNININIPKENNDSDSGNEIDEETEELEKMRETQGILGKWEIVEKEESIFSRQKNQENEMNFNLEENKNEVDLNEKFEKTKQTDNNDNEHSNDEEENSDNDYYLPGVINKKAFLHNEFGNLSENEEEEEDYSNNDQNHDTQIKKLNENLDNNNKDLNAFENIENLEDRGTIQHERSDEMENTFDNLSKFF